MLGILRLFLSAAAPIGVIGLGLLLYNFRRFNNPFEFGWRYMLTAYDPTAARPFALQYLAVNLRVYFVEWTRWSRSFPFVRETNLTQLPAGYGMVEGTFGILANLPLVWLALAAPLAVRNRIGATASVLRWFLAAVAILFGTCALALCFFFSACGRYEVDFLPALVLLALVGILGLERALAPRPGWRRLARGGWVLLLAFSIAFNLLLALEHSAQTQYGLGYFLFRGGRYPEAIRHFESALRVKRDSAEIQNDLAWVLATADREQGGDPARALQLAQQACATSGHRNPNYLATLAAADAANGRFADAIATAKQTIALAMAAGDTQLVNRIELRIKAYQAGRSYFDQGLSTR